MAKKSLPALSPAETEILRFVWQLEPATVQEICDSLPKDRSIAYATVQTLLRRLEKKGYVQHEVQGKAHLFSAAVKREQVIKRTVGDFVERLFGGDPLPLMLHLADQSDLNADDIDELKKLIERRGMSNFCVTAGEVTMTSPLNIVASFLVEQSCQISIVVGLVLVACWILRNASAHWRYLLWLVVIAKCLIPPMVALPLPVLPAEEGTMPLTTVTDVPSPISDVDFDSPMEIAKSSMPIAQQTESFVMEPAAASSAAT